ncbi:MAG: tetratricopeptide repeat protein [Deltaproteobacteria bacterium]|nr:tetratricopeptide repeat protein [Deltaproteobacteria bacterium]
MSAMTAALRACVLLPACFAASALAQPQQRFSSPAELMQMLESSDVVYKIMPLDKLDLKPDQLLDALFPPRFEKIEFPFVERQGGARRLRPFTFDPRAMAALQAAEPLFQKKDYPAAIAGYEKALGFQPDCYLALSHIGDCHLFSGQPGKALGFYERAIAANGFDHRTWYYKGNALNKLGRFAEARQAYIEALARFPRHGNSLDVLQALEKTYGVKVVRDLFAPQAFARREGEAVAVYFDPGGPASTAWLAYASAKAVWIGEPAHRKARTGAEAEAWSPTQELECLGALISTYADVKASGEGVAVRQLDRLLRIAKAGYLGEFILWEAASRIYPDVMQEQSSYERMKEFIRRFVVVEVK